VVNDRETATGDWKNGDPFCVGLKYLVKILACDIERQKICLISSWI
jgi:hypothetical protein